MVPTERGLSGNQGQSECDGKMKNPCPLSETEPQLSSQQQQQQQHFTG
jgi:hypothetical protein